MNTQRIFSITSAIAASRHALLPLVLLFAFAAPAAADIRVAMTVAPPALPVYVQPLCPGDGYIWTPGYWAWAEGDYYWVPGTWVLAPEPGLLWTPGYWAWEDVRFVFHDGYWGPHVGFYGGINYGFGYGGVGFEGGYWQSGRFYYNRAIANVSETTVHNVYTKTVIHNTINVVSYNGGSGGTIARPTTAELHAAAERHVPPVIAQDEHMRLARSTPALRAESNHGQPPIAATQRVSQFSGRGAVEASRAGEPYHPAAERRVASRGTGAQAAHASAPGVKSTVADSSRYDATAQREARDMQARHQKEQQELRDRQAAEQTEMARQHVSEERRQAMAAVHARQQQELARRHEQEEQEFEAQHKRRDPA
jgi:hypothetical protein